ncbi:MAG: DUF4129 domain-containing protein, partial [Pyrinomonadaceae bacterium]|nr:DUF4129 domain-containing protein [Pyrinomonadaceae bacterium]
IGTATGGITATFGKYLEAIEMLWIQYFVAFDNQEQRSLFTSIRRGMSDYNAKATSWMEGLQETAAEWWKKARGDSGTAESVTAIGYGAAALAFAAALVMLFVWAYRKIVKLEFWRRLRDRVFAERRASVVEFYERMQAALAARGLIREQHQTPLEFAYGTGIPAAVRVTDVYNRVRFGTQRLTDAEAAEIATLIDEIEASERPKSSR